MHFPETECETGESPKEAPFHDTQTSGETNKNTLIGTRYPNDYAGEDQQQFTRLDNSHAQK
jgi:hypothetical protein